MCCVKIFCSVSFANDIVFCNNRCYIPITPCRKTHVALVYIIIISLKLKNTYRKCIIIL